MEESVGSASAPAPASAIFLGGISPSIRAVEAVIREISQSAVPVLLLSEAGAGKHVLAKRLHDLSPRGGQAFHSASCANLTPPAFGMNVSKGGTLYLEEVSNLGGETQKALSLAATRQRENENAAGVIAHLVCGSTRDLDGEVRAGRFREDLYYQISGVCLRLPPLRQRKEDIPYLVDFFLPKYAKEFGRAIPQLSSRTRQLFQDYEWPGNIRELENAIKAIVALGDESVAMGGLRARLLKGERPILAERVSLKQASRTASMEAEKELILEALNRTRWNRRRAAQELQISYKALLYKMKQIGSGEHEPRRHQESI